MPGGAATSVSRAGVSITVPGSWYEFDIHPVSRDDNIRRMVSARVQELPELAPYRADITTLLRQMARDAWNSGALYCGCMAEGFGGVPLSATVTVSVVSGTTRQGRTLSTDPQAVAASFTEKRARNVFDTWRTVVTVDIPDVGLAARTFGVEDIEVTGDSRRFRAALMQTFVPVPGTSDRVAIVSGSSPVLDLAESFLDLFDAITSTFRFVPLDELDSEDRGDLRNPANRDNPGKAPGQERDAEEGTE